MPRLLTYVACFMMVFTTFGGARAAGETEPIVIFAYGDSLTAGLGLPAKDAFPAKLQAALRATGLAVEVINGGVSGDTSANGVGRFDWSLPSHVDAAIVEFGANDAFQGIMPPVLRGNLETIVQRLQAKGVAVMLAGMMAPRNLGVDYIREFDALYPDIARQYNCLLYPFYLDGVATDRSLNQADGIHPNAAGVDVIVARMLPTVERLIAEARQDRQAHSPHTSE